MFSFFLSCVINIGLFALHHEEPRRGIIALEMIYSHNYLQPTVLTEPYFKKPPLHNWFTVISSKLLGEVSEVSLRLPSTFMALLTALFLFLFARSFIGERKALLSSMVFLTTWTVLVGYSTKCEPDVTFTFFSFLSIASWYYFYKRGRVLLSWVSGYTFSALAFLTKGIPGFVFFFVSVFIALFLERKLRSFFSVGNLIGALIGVFIVSAWMFSVPFDKTIGALLGEVTSRTLSSYDFLHALKSILSFPFRYVLALFPWSFVIAIYLFRRKFNVSFDGDFLKFLISVVFVNSIIYMFSPGTRLRYLMPLFPFISIVFAYILSDVYLEHKRAKKIVQASIDILLILGIMFGLLVMGDNYHLVIYTILFLALSYFIHYYVFKRVEGNNLIVLISLVFLLIRGFYSAYYTPIAAFKYPDVRGVAREIVEEVKGRRLETKVKYLQLCFYVEKFYGKPLRFNSHPEKGVVFLSGKPEGKVLREFVLSKHKFYLCSF